jgi:hypothetical protein
MRPGRFDVRGTEELRKRRRKKRNQSKLRPLREEGD